jgi:hypothetical protein
MANIGYEWSVETILDSDDDEEVQDVDHFESYQQALDFTQTRDPADGDGNRFAIVLVKEYYTAGDFRAWATVEDGVMPDEFDDDTKVPKRFIEEVAKAHKA